MGWSWYTAHGPRVKWKRAVDFLGRRPLAVSGWPTQPFTCPDVSTHGQQHQGKRQPFGQYYHSNDPSVYGITYGQFSLQTLKGHLVYIHIFYTKLQRLIRLLMRHKNNIPLAKGRRLLDTKYQNCFVWSLKQIYCSLESWHDTRYLWLICCTWKDSV